MNRSVLCLVAGLALFGCNDSTSTSNESTSPILPNNSVPAVDQTVPVGGGEIRISDQSSPLRGFSIQVPKGAAPGAMRISVAYEQVATMPNAPGFSVASPLVTMRTDVVKPDSQLALTIPITVREGSFAMGFLYDPATGTYEGLPLVAESPGSITVVTSGAGLNPITSASARSSVGSGGTVSVVALAIDLGVLALKSELNTGFKPGTDDWEFTNYGSYLEPGGHCAGQSLTAMWYYYEKALHGGVRLHHAFDLVDKDSMTLWQDNPRGYKFASVVQADIEWKGWAQKAFFTGIKNTNLHYLSWRAFAATMLLTGEPQLVGLVSDSGGHAIIAHRMSLRDSILYVSDPNFPGKEKQIKFSGGKFQPYSSKQNAAADPRAYWGIGYFAKSALVDWAAIGKRYTEFEKGTIGTVAPNAFPAYTVESPDWPGWKGDTLLGRMDSVVLEVKCPGCGTSYSNSGHQYFEVFDTTGQKLADMDLGSVTQGLPRGQVRIPVPKTLRRFGLAIEGLSPITGQAGKATRDWLDFRWITLADSKLSLSPDSSGPDKGSLQVFSARRLGGVQGATMEWVVRNTKDSLLRKVTSTGKDTLQIRFENNGRHWVRVRLREPGAADWTDSALAVVDVQTKGMKSFSFSWKRRGSSSWPYEAYSCALTGSVEGLDGNAIDSVFMYSYDPGTIHIYMSKYGGRFRLQASLATSMDKAAEDTTYADGSKMRFSTGTPIHHRITTDGVTPYHYAQSDAVDLDRSGDGGVYWDAYMSDKLEQFDNKGVLVKTDTGQLLLPAAQIQLEWY